LAQLTTSSDSFLDLLGMRVEESAPDFCRMRLPFRPALLRNGGIMHGGAIASLLDTAGVMAIKAGMESEINGIPTITMTVNYLAPARETDVLAEARIIRRGRSLVFVEVKASSSSGELLATAQVVYKFGAREKSA
jgi:uncharacterized protein (TIGR00369 family)